METSSDKATSQLNCYGFGSICVTVTWAEPDFSFLFIRLRGCEGAKFLRGFKFRGGGGTDFRPAIAEAAKWKPDLLIYLTDLEGDAVAEPAFLILLAVPEGNAETPWGKIIELS